MNSTQTFTPKDVQNTLINNSNANFTKVHSVIKSENQNLEDFLMNVFKVDRSGTELFVYRNIIAVYVEENTGIVYAIKRLTNKKYLARETIINVYSEHPYINQFHSYDNSIENGISTGKVGTFAQPFGSLAELMNLGYACPVMYTDLMKIMVKMTIAIEYLHNRSIIHRDIKPDNFFINANLEPFLGDLGLARDEKVNASLTKAGTWCFIAPEVLYCDSKRKYTKRIDTHSLMSTFASLFLGYLPYSNCNSMEEKMFNEYVQSKNPYDDEKLRFSKDLVEEIKAGWDKKRTDFTMSVFREFIGKAGECCQEILDVIEKAETAEELEEIIKNKCQDINFAKDIPDISQNYIKTVVKFLFKDKSSEVQRKIFEIAIKDSIVQKALWEWLINGKKPCFGKETIISIYEETEYLKNFQKIYYNYLTDSEKCINRVNDVIKRIYDIESENGGEVIFSKNIKYEELFFFKLYKNCHEDSNFNFFTAKLVDPFEISSNDRDRVINITTHYAAELAENGAKGLYNVYFKHGSIVIVGQYLIDELRVAAIDYSYGSTYESAARCLKYTDKIEEVKDLKLGDTVECTPLAIREVLAADIVAVIGDKKEIVIPKGKPLEAIGVFSATSKNIKVFYDDNELQLPEKIELADLLRVKVSLSKTITFNKVDP